MSAPFAYDPFTGFQIRMGYKLIISFTTNVCCSAKLPGFRRKINFKPSLLTVTLVSALKKAQKTNYRKKLNTYSSSILFGYCQTVVLSLILLIYNVNSDLPQ